MWLYNMEMRVPHIEFHSWFISDGTKTWAMIMDDPDAMKAVGKVWVHWLRIYEH